MPAREGRSASKAKAVRAAEGGSNILTGPSLAGAAVFVLIVPATAIADEARRATASLQWTRAEGGESCMDALALERAVEALLERKAFLSPGQSDLSVEGSVEKLSGKEGFVAKLAMRTRDGQSLGVRELRTREPSCAALDGPLPLVLAMMVEEHERLPRDETSVVLRLPERTSPPPVVAPSAPPPAPPARPPAPSSPWGFRSSAEAGFVLGLLPGPSVGPRAELLVEPPHLPPFGVAMSFWPAVKYETAAGGGLFSAWHLGVSLCPHLSANPTVNLSACAGLDAGEASAVGLGLRVTHEQARPYVQAALRAVLVVRIAGPLGVEFSAGGAIPFLRTNFFYTTPGGAETTIYQAWPVLPTGSIGLDLGLPE